ncbi:hypothetical protein V3471_15030 [Flavobacterium oreochromis]|uniref:hypothetical protein n=1 Tax=Flavobacterium oreochromis TaxID=2906078 RepID=UPI00385D94FD
MNKKDKTQNTVFNLKMDETFLADHAKNNFNIDLDVKKELPKKAGFYAKMSVTDYDALQKMFLNELKKIKDIISFPEFIRIKIQEFSNDFPVEIIENLPKRISGNQNGFEVIVKRIEMNADLKNYIDSYIHKRIKETGHFTAVKFMEELTNYLKNKK